MFVTCFMNHISKYIGEIRRITPGAPPFMIKYVYFEKIIFAIKSFRKFTVITDENFLAENISEPLS